MPFYNVLKPENPVDRRTAEGLMRLKTALDAEIPEKTLDQTMLVASWNLREFGGTKSDGREQEPLLYIAEILSRFDLIAVQEVRDNLEALDGLMRMLGRWWKYVVSDVNPPPAGNNERHAFLYDTRKLSFGGMVGELTPAGKKQKGKFVAEAFSRSPYLAGFQAGWFKFTICTQHMYYGEGKDDVHRVRDAKLAVEYLKKTMKSKNRWAKNAILLGDFNVFHAHKQQDDTFKALETGGLALAGKLKGQYTNANLDKPFDQMGFLTPDVQHQLAEAKAGVFPFFDYVYREADHKVYLPKQTLAKYRQWRTYKMSDHLPIWVELDIDFSGQYLKGKLKPVKAS